jgi:hypothetical protein
MARSKPLTEEEMAKIRVFFKDEVSADVGRLYLDLEKQIKKYPAASRGAEGNKRAVLEATWQALKENKGKPGNLERKDKTKWLSMLQKHTGSGGVKNKGHAAEKLIKDLDVTGGMQKPSKCWTKGFFSHKAVTLVSRYAELVGIITPAQTAAAAAAAAPPAATAPATPAPSSKTKNAEVQRAKVQIRELLTGLVTLSKRHNDVGEERGDVNYIRQQEQQFAENLKTHIGTLRSNGWKMKDFQEFKCQTPEHSNVLMGQVSAQMRSSPSPFAAASHTPARRASLQGLGSNAVAPKPKGPAAGESG